MSDILPGDLVGWTDARLVSTGVYADVFAATKGGKTYALKIAAAQPRPLGEDTIGLCAARGLRAITGGLVGEGFGPDEVLKAEARCLSDAKGSPHLVQLFDQWTLKVEGVERHALTLEWIEGLSWRELLRQGERLSENDVTLLVDALTTSQEALPQHGDIKPDNIIQDTNGRIRLIDPSAGATVLDEDGFPQRFVLTPAYNPRYMPSDVPAVGLTAYEAVTGQMLFAPRPIRDPQTLGPKLRGLLDRAKATGRDDVIRRVVGIPPLEGPAHISRAALAAVGLEIQGDILELREMPLSLAELSKLMLA